VPPARSHFEDRETCASTGERSLLDVAVACRCVRAFGAKAVPDLARVGNAAAVVGGVFAEDEREEGADGVVGIGWFVADEDTKQKDGGGEVDAQVERGVVVADDACDRAAQPAAGLVEQRRTEGIREFRFGVTPFDAPPYRRG